MRKDLCSLVNLRVVPTCGWKIFELKKHMKDHQAWTGGHIVTNSQLAYLVEHCTGIVGSSPHVRIFELKIAHEKSHVKTSSQLSTQLRQWWKESLIKMSGLNGWSHCDQLTVGSVAKALHRYHGFESHLSLNFFRLSFRNCLSCAHNCDDSSYV